MVYCLLLNIFKPQILKSMKGVMNFARLLLSLKFRGELHLTF